MNKKKRISYQELLKDPEVKNWNENIKAGSIITGEVYLRTLGLYCKLNSTDPRKILEDAKEGKLKKDFMVFVRKLENEGKAGSYIVRFKKVISSWVKFNDISLDLRSVRIKEASRNLTVEDERVPTQEELSKIITISGLRGRVSIALMAFSGLRPETIGNFKGTDGLKLSDLPELRINEGKIEFVKVPTMVRVRSTLSKKRHEYMTFLPEEGCNYVKEYLESRMKEGEKLTYDSPLVALEGPVPGTHERPRTQLVTREIRKSIRKLNFKWRPYVLRSYFSMALDLSENKGIISHNWREYWMGHTGDISARYSTNKKLSTEMTEEMRETYKKCSAYLETGRKALTEEEKEQLNREVKKWYLSALGFTDEEIVKDNLLELEPEELQQKVREKLKLNMNNGHPQKIIPINELRKYIEEGWEYIRDLGDKEAIVRLPGN